MSLIPPELITQLRAVAVQLAAANELSAALTAALDANTAALKAGRRES